MKKLKNFNINKNELHPFHLVRPSPWPMMVSFSLFFFLAGLVKWLNFLTDDMLFLHIGGVGLALFTYFWFSDIVCEATFEGHHTRKVREGLRLGMKLFIISEVMFFFSFFFAYIYTALAPSIAIGAVWPPEGIKPIDPWELPALNTALLLASGVTVTWAHRAVVSGSKRSSTHGLITTILLGLVFTYLQYFEYNHATFAMNDSIYGSLFYIMTGFHGIHVIIGTAFLIVCLIRLTKGHLNRKSHFGLVAAIWYWHFVDVVWIALYGLVYIWAGWAHQKVPIVFLSLL